MPPGTDRGGTLRDTGHFSVLGDGTGRDGTGRDVDTFQRDTTGHGTLFLFWDGTGRGHFFEGHFGTQALNQFRHGTPRDTSGWDGTLRDTHKT